MVRKSKHIVAELFFQRQKNQEDGCCICAINNILEKTALSEKEFNALCYEFDKLYMCKGTSQFFFIESDTNIIQFVLAKFNISSTYYAPGSIKSLDELLEIKTKFLVFSSEHIWCYRKHANIWYRFDSMHRTPTRLNLKNLSAKLGFIVID